MTATDIRPAPGVPPVQWQRPTADGRPPGGHPAPRPGGPASSSQDRLWIGPTLVAALSVLAGSSALSSTIHGAGWVIPLIEVVGVVWLLGIGCRLLRSPAPVTVLVQFAGLAIALTGLFTTSGWGGFIPNAAVLREAGDLLSGAWQQILITVPPAPSSVELSFLICLTVGTTSLIVDFLVAEARSPALVALPLLCLYSVPASIATEQLPWPTFAAPAVMYAILLAVTGHIGARSRGRTNAGLIGSAVVISAVATTIAVLVGDAISGIGTEGRLPRTGGGSEIGLSAFTSLRGELQETKPRDLLTVTGLPGPAYLRTTTLQRWSSGANEGFSASQYSDDGPADGVLAGVDPGGATVAPVRVRSTQFANETLPIYARTVSTSGLADGWVFDSRLGTVHRPQKLNPHTYSLRSAFPDWAPDDLRTDTVTAAENLVQLGGVPDAVKTLATQVAAQAGTPFDKADAVLNYFRDPKNGFSYSLAVPAGSTGDALTDFLIENKTGFCEQYATGMAVMLRSIGIPARVAIGFTQGTRQSDGSWLITTKDAHAWVEVRFDQHGWVQFDPTPLGGGTGNQQGFDANAKPSGAATTVTEGSGAGSATTSSAATSSSRAVSGGALRPDDGRADGANSGSAGTRQVPAPGGGPAALWWTLAGVLVLLSLLAAPLTVRRVRRRQRLATAEVGGPGAAGAAWAEVEDLIVDHGLALRATESSRATANRLAKSTRLTDNARKRLRALVIAAEQEWYGAVPGHSDAVGKELVAAVAAVGASLDRSSPRTALDRLLPRSIRPSSRD